MTSINPIPLFDLSTILIPQEERRVVPIIVVRQPGVGTSSYLQDLAEEAGMTHHVVRCPTIDGDFRPLPVLDNGEVVYRQPSITWLKSSFMRRPHILLILDEAASGSAMAVSTILAQAADGARGPVYAMLLVGEADVGRAQSIIAEGLGILPGEVRVHRVVMPSQQFRAAVGFARANGVSDDIVDFLDARGNVMDLGMQTWIRYDAVMRNDTISSYEPRVVESISRGMLGDEAYESFRRWIDARKAAAA